MRLVIRKFAFQVFSFFKQKAASFSGNCFNFFQKIIFKKASAEGEIQVKTPLNSESRRLSE